MNAAYLCGKVGDEDQLTSDIFGLMRYLPPKLILWPFLKLARCFLGSEFGGMHEQVDFYPTFCDYFFWPAAHIPATIRNRALDRQPDLLILLRDSTGHSAAVVVEIKLSSIKHDVDARIANEPNEPDQSDQSTNEPVSKLDLLESDEVYGDQLADYFRALRDDGITLPVRGARSAKIEAMVANESWNAQTKLSAVPADKKFLLYLTDSYSPPDREIADTLSSFGQDSRSTVAPKLFWLGWSSLYRIVETELLSPSLSNETFREILRDILRLMDARDLREFSGWDKIQPSAASPSDLCFWTPRWFSDVATLEPGTSERINFWKEPLNPMSPN